MHVFGAMMIRLDEIKFWHIALFLVMSLKAEFVFAQADSTEQAIDSSAQAEPSKPLTWQEACKHVGTQDRLLGEKVERALREALRTPERTEVMACALVLQCVSRGDCDAVKAALSGMKSVFPQLSLESRCLVGRVRLWLWLTTDEPKGPEYATAAFREIVTSTHSGTLPKPELRADSQIIGTVCGMLGLEDAQSPIAVDNLKIAEQCLTSSKVSDVKSRFKLSQQAARERAESIEKTIASVRSKSIDLVVNEQADRKEKLRELGYEFTSTRELMIEVVRNSREVSRQNTVDRRKLADYVRRLNREWTIPTAGHPGQPPIEPRVPRKSDIQVDEYEKKSDGYETKTDANGNTYKKEKFKNERRSSSDIERDREREFGRLMAEYRIQKADFDRRIAIYVPLLKSWVETDRVRREKLQAEKMAAEARSEELLEKNKQLREEASDAKADFQDQRSEVEVLAEEYELTEIALKSLKSPSTALTYRPPNFELIDVDDEKFRLLGRIKK